MPMRSATADLSSAAIAADEQLAEQRPLAHPREFIMLRRVGRSERVDASSSDMPTLSRIASSASTTTAPPSRSPSAARPSRPTSTTLLASSSSRERLSAALASARRRCGGRRLPPHARLRGAQRVRERSVEGEAQPRHGRARFLVRPSAGHKRAAVSDAQQAQAVFLRAAALR